MREEAKAVATRTFDRGCAQRGREYIRTSRIRSFGKSRQMVPWPLLRTRSESHERWPIWVCQYRRGLVVHGVESFSQRLPSTREQVAVPVRRNPDRTVAEVVFDLLHVATVGNEDGRARVA